MKEKYRTPRRVDVTFEGETFSVIYSPEKLIEIHAPLKDQFAKESPVVEQMDAAIKALAHAIMDWGIEDTTGKKLPITLESLTGKLPTRMVYAIVREVANDLTKLDGDDT